MSRSTWHWSPELGRLVEGPGPRRVDGSGDGWRFSDRIYSASPFVGANGEVIDSKKKHREYMKRNNLTTVDDFKGVWDKAAKRREDVFTGKADRRERREAVERAMEKRHGN